MPSELWLFLLFGGVCLGSCLMGRPNCFVFPSHRFCPSSLTQRTWKAEKVLANVHLAAPAAGNPGGSQERGPQLTCCSSTSSPAAFIKPLVSMWPRRRMYRGRPSLGPGRASGGQKGNRITYFYIILHIYYICTINSCYLR